MTIAVAANHSQSQHGSPVSHDLRGLASWRDIMVSVGIDVAPDEADESATGFMEVTP